jgi:putative oxidoreductase
VNDIYQHKSYMMNSLLFNRWIFLGLRLILGGVFLYAGFLKMREPLAFADSIASFRILPNPLINLLALGLPPLEMIVGGMLLVGWRIRLASFAVLLLSLTFAIALGQALVRGLEVDCGCFGPGKPSLEKNLFSLGRDFLLIVGSAWTYRVKILKAK